MSLERVAQLSTAYADQETGERGYVLSGGVDSFLEPYENGRATADAARSAAPRRPRHARRSAGALDGPHHRDGRVARARPRSPRSHLRRDGDAQEAVRPVSDGQGKALFDQVQPRLRRHSPRGRRRRRTAPNSTSTTSAPALTTIFAAIIVVAIVGAIVAGFLIRRWITRPIDELADEVRVCARACSTRRSASPGPPELASLALDVDAMRGRIREQLVESERSRQAVEQSAAVVLTLRSELEPTVGRPARRMDGCRSLSARPKASSPATATTSSRPATARSRSWSSTSRARRHGGHPRAAMQGDAPHRADVGRRRRATRSTPPPRSSATWVRRCSSPRSSP